MEHKKIYNLIVFEDGKIYREFKKKCKLIKPNVRSHGYSTVEINGKAVYTHRLIMEAFRGKSELTVDHIDGDKTNNALYNLEYVTLSENVKRAYNIGFNRNNKKIVSKSVLWNGKTYESAKALSKELGFCESYVSQKIKRKQTILDKEVKFI